MFISIRFGVLGWCNATVLLHKFDFAFFLRLQAFFDKEYITSHPEDTEKITQLKDLMQEQVRCRLLTFLQSFNNTALPFCPEMPNRPSWLHILKLKLYMCFSGNTYRAVSVFR